MKNELMIVPQKQEIVGIYTHEEKLPTLPKLSDLKLRVGETSHIGNGCDENLAFVTELNAGIHEGDDGYYQVTLKGNKKDKLIIIQRVTDYTLKLKNLIIIQDYNHQDKPEHAYEIQVKKEQHAYDVTLSKGELMSVSRFEQKMTEVTHLISIMNDKQHRETIAKILSIDAPKITEYKKAGYNLYDDKQLFVCKNRIFSYGTSNIFATTVRLNHQADLKPVFKEYKEICSNEEQNALLNLTSETPQAVYVSALLEYLFNVFEKAYNGRIEPYMVMAMGVVVLFLKQITNDFKGMPMVILFGEAASGKSNLLELVANAYGLNKSVIHGGMDTTAGLIEDLENYVNIPLLVGEVEIESIDAIKRLIKSVFEQVGRKKYNCKNNINTTIFFNTNHEFIYDSEYLNRCIKLTFERNNFNCLEAEKFNKLQENLTVVSEYIIENIHYTTICNMIKEEEQSEFLSIITDKRMKRNLAIVITGLKILIQLINKETITFEQFEDRLGNYISSVCRSEEDNLCRFITVLKELLNERYGKLERNVDYKICKDGLHLQVGKHSETLKMHYTTIFNQKFKHAKPLELKQYRALLLQKGAEMKSVHYSHSLNSRHGIFLPFDKFDDLTYLADRLDCYSEQYSSALENQQMPLNNDFVF